MTEFPQPPMSELHADTTRFAEIRRHIESFRSGEGLVPLLGPLFDRAQQEINRARAAGEMSPDQALVGQEELTTLVRQWAEVLEEKLDGAQHDKLTGFALNDLFIQERDGLVRKQREVLAADPNREFYTAIFVFDVNSLKMVNDRFGHAVGNQLIQEVARRIRQSVGEINIQTPAGDEEGVIIGRTGGDEFVLIADKIFAKDTPSDDHISWVTRLEDTLRRSCAHFDFSVGGEMIEAATSIGLAHGAEFEARPDEQHGESDEDSLEVKAKHYFRLGN